MFCLNNPDIDSLDRKSGGFMKLRMIAATTLIAFCFQGCQGIDRAITGPPPIISPQGPSMSPLRDPIKKRPYDIHVTTANLILRFNDAVGAAAARNASPDQVERMRDTGLALVYSNCDHFFSSLGRYQTQVNTSADIVTALSTLATGALALVTFKNADTKDALIASLSLGVAGAKTALDIYARNFLFGAENVDSVRELTFKALAAHREKFVKLVGIGFEDTILNLIDHQNICTPSRIARLAKQAIANGQVVARPISTDGLDAVQMAAAAAATKQAFAIDQQTDEDALRTIGALFGRGPVSPDQAGALWWVFNSDADPARLKKLSVLIGGLSSTQLIDDNGVLTPAAQNMAQTVVNGLRTLSAATQNAFRGEIARVKRAENTADASADQKEPHFSVGATKPAATGTRIEVNVPPSTSGGGT